ncbi:polysaccharide deacetylase family protein [Thermoactinomyces sp. CICC 10523]|uniref:polysaccharide deacetylase family protein n=1 Tax=Thermoactinomyces sp. CICC 10523 TaxID=2767428 RepID=UPI0018DC604B|nr:polysaccharide deacetylase family protein [Thermoactinomyces sp. CICC 10523]MBH8598648.1 polysaccharide deacetylase family protein [Thermoactinomyces sp. CICC 10523]
MWRNIICLGSALCLTLLTACSGPVTHIEAAKTDPTHSHETKASATKPSPAAQMEQLEQTLLERYGSESPHRWGEHFPGIIDRLPTKEKVIALTFDACGGKHGNGYDRELIDYLNKERIPATLFINSRWIEANPQTFMKLAHNPLFEIENHGTEHRPLSVTGRSAYGIGGTKNAAAVINEVLGNDQLITRLTGRKPKFFRTGTAFYDDVAVKLVYGLGEKPVNYDILGDAGATYNTRQVEQALLTAKPGSIVIMHMNQPSHDTAEGVIKSIPLLKKKGFRFVKLEDYLH